MEHAMASHPWILPAAILSAFALPGSAPAAEPAAPALEFFEKQVRPLLAAKCLDCHGGKKSKGGLRLDSRERILKGGDTGPAIVPGKPESSLLIKALHYGEEPRMPPKGKLKDDEIRILTRWVALGAPWPESAGVKPNDDETFTITEAQRRFWSFQPLREILPPKVADEQGWARTSIDRFVFSRLDAAKLRPTATADVRALLRRATFDLTGLPPTAEEVAAFEKANDPEAFARVIDRLLASPHYGERWGRHWLDVVRYADTAGETADFPAPEAWRYRNYVIDAFNTDKPYDAFVREQLAGDLLAADAPADQYASLMVATGYLAVARRFGFDPAADHYLTIEDTIDTLGKSILGLSLGCARCHDHKYDPVSNLDYYALYGIFDSTRYAFPGSEKEKRPRDLVPMISAAEYARVTGPLQKRLGELDAELKKMTAQRAGNPAPAPAAVAELKREKDAVAAQIAAIPVAYAVQEGKVHDARLQRRGDPSNLGPEVPRRFLTVFGGEAVRSDGGSGRRALADWLTRGPAAPLVARVIVNRVWQGHFGTGLVGTPNDFGSRGMAPTHPQLLDYLADRFVRDGWSMKKLHRLIMLSAVYQQASGAAPSEDPNNLLLTRFPRRRLSAEEVRDSILLVSGDLNRTPGRGHPFPAESTWQFTQHNPFTAVYDHDQRSVYLMTQRIKRHPFLSLFDGADPNATVGRRDTTTVPTQALFFLNDPFVHRKSARLAERLLALPSDDARVEAVYRVCYARAPMAAEQERAKRFLAGGADARQAWAAWARVMFASNEFLYVD
jgi:hypothetical protein